MAQYTQDDLANAEKFCKPNTIIRTINKLYTKAPHLTSWLEYEIRDATLKDYYYPATLKHCSKVMTVKISKSLCENLSCNPMKEKSSCVHNEPASYYYVGDDNSYDVQCQPACFNTINVADFPKRDAKAPQTLMLNWNNASNECHLANAQTVTYLEKPFYRSKTKYEVRVNDMPTGFSRIEDKKNIFGAGMAYIPNKTYCQYYDRTLMSDLSCDLKPYEKFLDAIVGQTLINYIKSGIRMLQNNNIPFPLPELDPLPSLKEIHTLEGWKKI